MKQRKWLRFNAEGKEGYFFKEVIAFTSDLAALFFSSLKCLLRKLHHTNILKFCKLNLLPKPLGDKI